LALVLVLACPVLVNITGERAKKWKGKGREGKVGRKMEGKGNVESMAREGK